MRLQVDFHVAGMQKEVTSVNSHAQDSVAGEGKKASSYQCDEAADNHAEEAESVLGPRSDGSSQV
jgi:hypothetical protein